MEFEFKISKHSMNCGRYLIDSLFKQAQKSSYRLPIARLLTSSFKVHKQMYYYYKKVDTLTINIPKYAFTFA